MPTKTLSDRINAAMIMRDMTQADIARATGMSTALVSKVCSGKAQDPRFTTVVKIANALDVSLEYLAGIKK